MSLNPRQLEAFQAVMRHGAVTRAATALGISQPAVSRLVADLEIALGFQLFLRAGGRVTPTPEAESFMEELERSYVGLDRLVQAAAEIRDQRRGHVRLAALPAMALALVPRLLGRFAEAHPGVKVTFDVHTSARIVDLVAAGQFHLGLAHLPESRGEVETLAAYRLACVAALPAEHALTKRRRLTPKDLAGVPLVALAHHTVTARHISQAFLAADVRPAIAVECQPSYAACALVAQGVGVAIVDPLTAAVFDGKDLVTRPFAPEIPFDVRLLRPAKRQSSTAAEALADLLLAGLGREKRLQRL